MRNCLRRLDPAHRVPGSTSGRWAGASRVANAVLNEAAAPQGLLPSGYGVGKRMLLPVIGKRDKERALPLTEPTLAMLREVWKIHHSKKWLFPNRKGTARLSGEMTRQAFNAARAACGFDDHCVPHTLRHRLALRLLEKAVEFLRRLLMYVLPKGLHKLGYCRLWHHSKRHLQQPARLLLTLLGPVRLAEYLLIADIAEEANRLPEKARMSGRGLLTAEPYTQVEPTAVRPVGTP